MTRARAIRLGVLLVATAMLHASMPAVVSWWPAAPAFALALIVAAAWTAGPAVGALAGFGAGLMLDVVPPAAHPIGLWAIVLAVLGYTAAVVLHHEERLVPALLTVAMAVALAPLLYALIAVTLNQTVVTPSLSGTLTAFGWGLAGALLTLPAAQARRRPQTPLKIAAPLPAGLLEDWERAA